MELVVLSGKGGTGKTTVATCLIELSEEVTSVDCDVDAPNLYLYYQGKELKKEDFYSSKKAVINHDICLYCGTCRNHCNFDAIDEDINIDLLKCEGCGTCVLVCNQNAISLIDEKTAELFINQIDNGIISRAEMEIGADGSGKIVSKIRENAKEYTKENSLTIIDGSPGIGCAVISSITGCDVALIVTEPTKSGLADLKRMVELTRHFQIITLVCINKYDINIAMTNMIKDFCKSEDLIIVGEIPFDDLVRTSINELRAVIYYKESTANQAIRLMWEEIKKYIQK